MAVEAGRLKDKIVLLKPVRTRDEWGQEIVDWQRLGPFWAEVVGSGGGTAVSLNRSSITYSHTVRIRKSSQTIGTEADYRLEWKNRVFEISSVVEADGDIYELDCADERPYSEKPVIKDADAILWDDSIHDPIGNAKTPDSPINTRRQP